MLFAEHNWLVFLGESTVPADPLSHWSSIEARLEHDVHGWVKAAFESTKGQVGTVGAMAMDDFLQKMKEVFWEIVTFQASSAEPVLPLVELLTAPVPSGPSVTRVSESLDLASSVLTAFGDGVVLSVVAKSANLPSLSAAKPGKNLIRSNDGF